jgi:hypothetical protein
MKEREEAALFILDCPLDEIGGTILTVVEKHQYKTITTQQAIEEMVNNFGPFLDKFIENQKQLLSEFVEFV